MSEYNFKGIKPESIELLCLNRFNDSKEFYEEHKLELKEGITVPMRQIVLDLSGLMYEDIKMNIRAHRFSILNFFQTVSVTAWDFGLGNNQLLKKFII